MGVFVGVLVEVTVFVDVIVVVLVGVIMLVHVGVLVTVISSARAIILNRVGASRHQYLAVG